MVACRKTLEGLDCTVAYVNSIAASAWAVAAKMLGAKVVIHAHELDQDLRRLLLARITCLDIGVSADAVVVAADAVAKALGRTLGYLPSDVINIGVLLTPTRCAGRLRTRFRHNGCSADLLVRSQRKIIGMCGTGPPAQGRRPFHSGSRQGCRNSTFSGSANGRTTPLRPFGAKSLRPRSPKTSISLATSTIPIR